MATAPQAANLPLFYNDLMPLNSRDHGTWSSRSTDKAKWLVNQHAIPLTVEEFPQAQRNFPIIFSQGENPVPLALMGLNEGVNVFVDAEGVLTGPVYVPAYARRYPFMLARLSADTSELALLRRARARRGGTTGCAAGRSGREPGQCRARQHHQHLDRARGRRRPG